MNNLKQKKNWFLMLYYHTKIIHIVTITFLLLPFEIMGEEVVATVSFLTGNSYCYSEKAYSNCYQEKGSGEGKIPLSVDFYFFEGDIVYVQKGGKVDFQFRNGTTIRQMEGQVEIKENGLDAKNFSFKAFINVTKQLSNKLFQMKNETATVGVRGTEFFFKTIGENEDGFSIKEDGIEPGVYVTSGVVEVAPKTGCILGLFCKEAVEVSADNQVIFDGNEEFEVSPINSDTKSKLNSASSSKGNTLNSKPFNGNLLNSDCCEYNLMQNSCCNICE